MAHHPRDDLVAQLPHLRAFARSLVGGGRADLADDLVQDTVALALRSWRLFTPGTDLKAWLFRILHNRCRSVLRRRHVTSEVGVDDLADRAAVPASQEGALEVVAFKRAFARLGPRHREVLVLAGVHGLPYEEIARIVGCELGTVKSRTNRARNLLKAMLLGEGGSLKAGAADRLLGRGDRPNQVLVRDGGHDVSPAVRGSGHLGLSPGHLSRSRPP